MPALQMIPTNKVVAGDENPRGAIDTRSEAFKELCASIKARGILQPILVGPSNGDGKHKIVAGHRRHAAATATSLKEMPAMVLDLKGSELLAALAENIQREDLSPVAEARAIKELQDRHGFTQVQAGEALSKSERWVRERLRLLPLPKKTQAAYDAGDLPLESLVPVEKLAKQAPKAADALAKAAKKDESIRTAVGGDRVPDALNYLIKDAEKDEKAAADLGCLVFITNGDRFGVVTLDVLKQAGATKAELDKAKNHLAEAQNAEARLQKVDRYGYHGHPQQMWLRGKDAEAARTFGCLLELGDSKYVTDAAWLADRFIAHVDAEFKIIEGKIAEKKSAKKPAKADQGSAEDEQAAKEERKRQREVEQQARAEARSANLEFGQRAHRALQAPKLSLEEAKLMALMVVGNNGEGLGARGLIYAYHDFQTEEALKNGGVRVTYAAGRDAGADLVKAIKSAKKPAEAIGLALRAAVLAHFVDQTCVAPSSRSYFSLSHVADSAVTGLIEEIAEQRQLLPDSVREAKEEARQLAADRAELELLLEVKGSRAKEGARHDALLDSNRITADLIEEALRSRYLKEHPDGELSYTILGAGTKRLEKLKAAEKERQAAK